MKIRIFFAILEHIGVLAFTISGALVAIDHETDIFGVIIMSFVTMFSGGIMRDVILGDIPLVLRKRVYAIASIIGASIYYLLWYLKADDIAAMLISVLVTVGMRVMATVFKWNIPKAIKFF